ncbi:FUSC family protein [Microbacterium esteraromaticum]|uniref:FUSC family protein n=1 Tax=Microbacterium esteraromaticum TaxID=57043 RepID=A0A7D7WGI9_9MICO|nr:FUSC family protein [Microbacterium esteraromaticum]QMU96954.1 FUSC family protein [Microbacterium esteraromaticum]
MRFPAAIRAARRAPLLQVLKSAAATIAAWLIAGWLIPGPLPVFAAIAALLVVQPSVNQSLSKALERSAGVILGVVIAVLLSLVLGAQSWVVLAAVVVAMLVAWSLRASTGTGNQVAISAVLVLALGSSNPDYALDRILETLIGAAIGFVVNIAIVPPALSAPARRDIGMLGRELAASLDRLAQALPVTRTPAQLQELMLEARLLRPMKDSAEASLTAAAESLSLNPRRGRHRDDIDELRAVFERLSPVVTQVIGMTRAYIDHYDDSLATDPTVRAIAEQLHRAGHDVRLAVQSSEGAEPDALTSAVPALTTPLVVRPPASDHWILVGSLMEDLRRIHGELRDET